MGQPSAPITVVLMRCRPAEVPRCASKAARVECIAIIQRGGDQGMGDFKQGLSVQEEVQLVHYMDLCKGLPSHGCHCSLNRSPKLKPD